MFEGEIWQKQLNGCTQRCIQMQTSGGPPQPTWLGKVCPTNGETLCQAVMASVEVSPTAAFSQLLLRWCYKSTNKQKSFNDPFFCLFVFICFRVGVMGKIYDEVTDVCIMETGWAQVMKDKVKARARRIQEAFAPMKTSLLSQAQGCVHTQEIHMCW